MTRTEIMALDSHALDVAVAEMVMGWKLWRSPVAKTKKPDCWSTKSRRSPTIMIRGWKPSRDHNQVREVLAEIEKRGLEDKFCVNLGFLLMCESNGYPKTWRIQWQLLTANPKLICRAALLALSDGAGEGT
jgi:hypothetical protein